MTISGKIRGTVLSNIVHLVGERVSSLDVGLYKLLNK